MALGFSNFSVFCSKTYTINEISVMKPTVDKIYKPTADRSEAARVSIRQEALSCVDTQYLSVLSWCHSTKPKVE